MAAVQGIGVAMNSATPLGLGVFSVLAAYGYWFVLLFALLYCITPFLWARQAETGWQPGLAFGLGTILRFAWLLPAAISKWNWFDSRLTFMFVAVIWLVFPLRNEDQPMRRLPPWARAFEKHIQLKPEQTVTKPELRKCVRRLEFSVCSHTG